MCTYKLNQAKNGIELYFDNIPPIETRETLKNAGWRWSRFGGCWYNKQSEENLTFAQSMSNGEEKKQAPKQENKPFELTTENLKACINFEKWNAHDWSDVATISRAIKAFMKKAGISCTVSSSQFSGGDSVTVTTTDLKYETEQKLTELFELFEGGYFDGMNDIYEYFNKPGIPTTKYFFYNNELSEQLKDEIEVFLKKEISNLSFDDWSERRRWINNAHQGKLTFPCPVFGN